MLVSGSFNQSVSQLNQSVGQLVFFFLFFMSITHSCQSFIRQSAMSAIYFLQRERWGRHRERERWRQRHREREREREGGREREGEGERDPEKKSEGDRQTDRQTDRQRK